MYLHLISLKSITPVTRKPKVVLFSAHFIQGNFSLYYGMPFVLLVYRIHIYTDRQFHRFCKMYKRFLTVKNAISVEKFIFMMQVLRKWNIPWARERQDSPMSIEILSIFEKRKVRNHS